jgi:hypothetical protein
MNWKPGQPVLTEHDRLAWQEWRRESKREAQRIRRALNPRIDYYPDTEADALIRSMVGPFVGCDYSTVINRIVGEWADHCHRKLPATK